MPVWVAIDPGASASDTTLPCLREHVTPSHLQSPLQDSSSSSHAFLKTCRITVPLDKWKWTQSGGRSASDHMEGVDSCVDGFI